jgi:hypothetical protein
MKQVYGEEVLGCSAVFKCHQHFAQGRDTLEDNEHSHRPKAVRTERKIEEAATLVHANPSKLVDDITAAVGISHGMCHKILTDDLNMLHDSEHCVPHVLAT